AGFTNPITVLGEPTRSGVTPFSPPFRTSQILSVGAGGSLTVHLHTPIENDPFHPFGSDFVVFGNTGFIITNGNFSGGGITDGSILGHNTGTTRVSVSADGTNFFVLNPALAPTVDGLFPTESAGNPFLAVNPALTGSAFAGTGLAGIRTLYGGSSGGTGYDLAWAQDTNGQSVALPAADFVRIEVLSGKSEIDSIAVVPGQSLYEDFASDPLNRGWRIFGDSSLFAWNAANQNIQATWDSSRSNSYLQRSLGTILNRQDNFSVAFDLRLNDIVAGFDSNRP